jgi:protein-L-isoaspartate O-methyltransferase
MTQHTDPPELQGTNCFDAIHVGASLTEVPRAFVQLLRPGGRLVLPLGAMHGAAPQVRPVFV